VLDDGLDADMRFLERDLIQSDKAAGRSLNKNVPKLGATPLGEALVRTRMKAGLSKWRIYVNWGLDTNRLGQCECGYRLPERSELEVFAKACGVSPEPLLQLLSAEIERLEGDA
jgi:hypothetical protein